MPIQFRKIIGWVRERKVDNFSNLQQPTYFSHTLILSPSNSYQEDPGIAENFQHYDTINLWKPIAIDLMISELTGVKGSNASDKKAHG